MNDKRVENQSMCHSIVYRQINNFDNAGAKNRIDLKYRFIFYLDVRNTIQSNRKGVDQLVEKKIYINDL